MDSSLAILFLLSLFGCKGRGSSTPEIPGPGWPGAPISYPTSTPPWPQIVPSGLPPFPGAGWEFDEPPPAAVQQRAGQLVTPLWARGSGAFKLEQTAGRWIAYQAQVVASGRKGVVAYRMKAARALPPTEQASKPVPAAPSPTAAPSTATSSPAAPAASPATTLPLLKLGMGLKPAAPVPEVKLLQTRLGIAADGRFGKDTDAAVRRFQAQRGLTVDGKVGQKTWVALLAVTV